MHLVSRMALIALVIGASTAVVGTGRLTWSLVVSGTLLWSVVPLLQLLSGVLLIRRADRQALDGYFSTHRSWSMWLLAGAAAVLVLPDPGGALMFLAATAVVPIILTARALAAFCRDSLGLSRASARRRVGLHQVVTYAVVLAYADFAVALMPRILALVGK
ncbi:MAG TPA: hypothetical protein VNJ03_06790 [Vicinamibacterales bacterium]|nr:hypothetical protein [Vicinamibacterales bacterium]